MSLPWGVQVGKDQKAQAFLATLDKDPMVGKMVDATSYYELEAEEYARKGITLTPDVWLVKARSFALACRAYCDAVEPESIASCTSESRLSYACACQAGT